MGYGFQGQGQNAGPPQVFLHPLGGPGEARAGGTQENAGPPQVFLHPLGEPGEAGDGGTHDGLAQVA